MAGFTVEQVISRGGTMWAVAMIVHTAISFVACRFRGGSTGRFFVTLTFGISRALAVVGASVALSYATAWAMRPYANHMDYEVYAAICFVGGIAGLYLGTIGGIVAQHRGAILAGAPIEPIVIRQIVRFKSPAKLSLHHSDADKLYGVANTVAWVFLAVTIGVCLWHDAPNSLLLSISVIIGIAGFVAASFTPGVLSKDAIQSDANAGLFLLVQFCPIGLALRAMYRFELVDWRWPLVAAAVVGLPAAYILLQPLRKASSHNVGAIFLAAFLCYSGPGSLVWSALQFANAIGSPSLVAAYHTRISAKHEQRGKNSTMYWINTANPPDLNGIVDIKLDSATYEHVSVGAYACIRVWRGLLPLRWYTVDECPTISRPA